MQVILHLLIIIGQQKLLDSWGNGLKVCVIDDLADQTIGITTDNLFKAGAIVGQGVTVAVNDVVIPGAGTTSTFNGYLKGIITGVSTDATGVLVVQHLMLNLISCNRCCWNFWKLC